MRRLAIYHSRNMKFNEENIMSVIRKYGMDKKCNMSEDALKLTIKRAVVANHIAFVLADAANSCLIDCENYMKKLGVSFDGRDKFNFNKMLDCVKGARKWTKEAAFPLFGCDYDGRDDNINDSDWWYNLVKLIENRLGGDDSAAEQLIDYILSIGSDRGVFNVTREDFFDSV